MSGVRCTVYENRNPRDGKLVLIPPGTSTQQFINMASNKLGINGRKVFHSEGGEIDDIMMIRDNDKLYISCGEAFQGSADKKAGNADMYSIAVMGPGAVGKSAMTLQYVQGVFVLDYDPTIEDAYRKNVAIDGNACLLDILDTAGQEDYTALRSTWMRERDGFIMVYSMTDGQTIKDLNTFYDQLAILNEDSIPPIVIAGNKSDLKSERVVSYEEGKKTAESLNAAAFFETSAKTGSNVDKCYEALVRAIREKQSRQNSKKKGGKTKKGLCVVL